MKYPKIPTLYERDATFRVDANKVTKPHFANVRRWIISEKIDGTNVRVGLTPHGEVSFEGRDDESQMPIPLLRFLKEKLTPEVVGAAFEIARDKETHLLPEVAIFGEGYGPGIGKHGDFYRDDVAFIVFDVVVGSWWLSRENVADVARKLGMEMAPELGMIEELPKTEEDLARIISMPARAGLESKTLEEVIKVIDATSDAVSPLAIAHGKGIHGGIVPKAEGIVARPDPMMFFNDGNPIMWKLKFKDYKAGKPKKPKPAVVQP